MEKYKIIVNGTIVDGSGKKPYKADVLIKGDKIETIGNIPQDLHATVIDASGKAVTPGFFDAHRHCDFAIANKEFGEIELTQGITSAITGSCGLTPFPMPSNAAYKNQLMNLLFPCLGSCPDETIYKSYVDFVNFQKTARLPINIGNLIGSCSIRIAVKGFEEQPFTKREMQKAKNYVEEAMQNGAFGLSMGLMYYPEYYSTSEELIEIAKSAAKYGRVLTCHIRGEGDSLFESIKEIIDIAEKAEIPLQISHFKSCGVKNWGKDIYKSIDYIESKRAANADVMLDFYPYTGGSTTLMSLIPPSYMKGTLEETWRYMSTPQGVDDFRGKINAHYANWDNYVLSLGFERIIISSCELAHNKLYCGKSIQDIAEQYNIDPIEFMCGIMAEEEGKAGIIVMSMSPDDVDAIAKLPYSYLISDALYSNSDNPHPRLYGSFPKLIRDFVIERKILALEEAIAKMTGIPAKRMGANRRGLIKENYYADINIFDPSKFKDLATFDHAKQIADGMDYVMVNGCCAMENNNIKAGRYGLFLRKEK